MTRLLLCSSILLACSAVTALHAAAIDPIVIVASSTSDDYQKGTAALDQQQWQDAIADFDRVIAGKSRDVDAALYWKAYALNKLGRSALVQATCIRLHSSFPASSWNPDCATLNDNAADDGIYGGASGSAQGTAGRLTPQQHGVESYHSGTRSNHGRSLHREADEGSDTDTRMLGINSLLRRDPAQAILALRGILSGSAPPVRKHRALSVLGMSQSPEAQTLLRDVAMGKVAPSEQAQAILAIAIYQGKRGNDTLFEVYRSSADRNVKRAVISALFISQDSTRLVELARSEKDLSLKHDIVAQLALMKDKAASDYMLELLK